MKGKKTRGRLLVGEQAYRRFAPFNFGGWRLRKRKESVMENMWKLELEITGFNPGKANEIIRICTVEWVFGEEDFDIALPDIDGPKIIWASGTGPLYVGESKDELIERLVDSIQRVNGSSCHIKVEAKCLEDKTCGDESGLAIA